MKADDIPKRKPAAAPSETNGAGAARADEARRAAPPDGKPSADGRAQILARYALVEVGDYYQVLGVARDATPAELERAHARLTRELSPEELGPGLAGELGAELAAIRTVAEEARRILGDPRLRARYSARL